MATLQIPSTTPRPGNAQGLANGLGWFSIGLGTAQLLAPDRIGRLIGQAEAGDWNAAMRLCGLREVATGIGILALSNPASGMWARVAGDLVDLAALGSLVGSPGSDRRRAAAATAVVAGVTALDIYCSRQLTREATGDGRLSMTKTIIVNRPPEAVYNYWRRLENFSVLVDGLDVMRQDGRRYTWRMRLPGGRRVAWEAEIDIEQPHAKLAWHATADADVPNAGTVRFERATGGRGTLVKVDLEYSPPGGRAGAGIAKLFGAEPGQLVETALRRMKQVLETGAVVHSDASIHSGMHPAVPATRGMRRALSFVSGRSAGKYQSARKREEAL